MKSAIDISLESADQTVAQQRLSLQVRRALMCRFDAKLAIEFLVQATQGDIYICGGTLRRRIFNGQISSDVDIMIPNGDDRAFKALDALHIPFVLNSHRHRRYRWNYLEIDIFHPRDFFGGFDEVYNALCFFDLKINSLALHWRSNRIIDPYNILSKTPVTDPGINWPHWALKYPQHVVILAIRLAKVFHEVPSLTISPDDAQRLRTSVVPQIRDCNWNTVHQRFPLGKAAFLRMFETTVLDRILKIDQIEFRNHPHRQDEAKHACPAIS